MFCGTPASGTPGVIRSIVAEVDRERKQDFLGDSPRTNYIHAGGIGAGRLPEFSKRPVFREIKLGLEGGQAFYRRGVRSAWDHGRNGTLFR